MNVLGLAGSPRSGGNSELLLDQALKGSMSAGAAVERIRLADADIGPCKACAVCKQSGVCIVEDGLVTVRERMEAADVYLFATPIYFWGASAQLKALIDRWYSFQVKGQGFMRGKKAGLICTFAAAKPDTARHTIGMFEDALRYVGIEFNHKLLVSAGDIGDVPNNGEAMNDAFCMGQELVTS